MLKRKGEIYGLYLVLSPDVILEVASNEFYGGYFICYC